MKAGQRFVLVIATENAAFEDDCDREVIEILADLVIKYRADQEVTTKRLQDRNGNTVGAVAIHRN